MTTIVEKSLDLLHRCSIAEGFIASSGNIDNYGHVWCRDSCIIGLLSLAEMDPSLRRTFEASLETLALNQGASGEIPSNVNPLNQRVSYGTTVGRIDASIWFIIGLCVSGRVNDNDTLVSQYWNNMEQAAAILDAWEFNRGGLLYIPVSGDWADEYLLSGYLLYDQSIRLWAMRELTLAAKRLNRNAIRYEQKALQIQTLISLHYSPCEGRNFFLAGFNPAETFDVFDALGNAICLLLKVGSEQERDFTLDHALACSCHNLVPAFHPIIERTNPDYRKLEAIASTSGRQSPRNVPGRFHNGGLWPFINAFWIMAATVAGKHKAAECWSIGVNQANEQEAYSFYEYLDANTGKGGGMAGQAWSAAASLVACAPCKAASLLFVDASE